MFLLCGYLNAQDKTDKFETPYGNNEEVSKVRHNKWS